MWTVQSNTFMANSYSSPSLFFFTRLLFIEGISIINLLPSHIYLTWIYANTILSMIQILFTVEIHHNKIKIMNEDQTFRARLVTSTELVNRSLLRKSSWVENLLQRFSWVTKRAVISEKIYFTKHILSLFV